MTVRIFVLSYVAAATRHSSPVAGAARLPRDIRTQLQRNEPRPVLVQSGRLFMLRHVRYFRVIAGICLEDFRCFKSRETYLKAASHRASRLERVRRSYDWTCTHRGWFGA